MVWCPRSVKEIFLIRTTAWKVSKYGVFFGFWSECGKIRTRKKSVFEHISRSGLWFKHDFYIGSKTFNLETFLVKKYFFGTSRPPQKGYRAVFSKVDTVWSIITWLYTLNCNQHNLQNQYLPLKVVIWEYIEWQRP